MRENRNQRKLKDLGEKLQAFELVNCLFRYSIYYKTS